MSLGHVNGKCVGYLHYIKHPLRTKLGWNNIMVTGEHIVRLLKLSAVLLE